MHIKVDCGESLPRSACPIGAMLCGMVPRPFATAWRSVAGFCLAAALGLYMIWKIIRTLGEL